MEDNKSKNLEFLKSSIILIVCIWGMAGLFTFNQFSNGYYREWLTLMTNLAGILLSIIFATAGVILTINRNYDNETKKQMEKLRKLKVIIKFEIENFINSFEKEILIYVKSRTISMNDNISKINKGRYDLECFSEKINFNNIYKIDSKFKDYIYDLILLDNTLNEESLMEFYTEYNLLEKNLPTINEEIIGIKEPIIKFLSDEYGELINYVHHLGFNDDNGWLAAGLSLISEDSKRNINEIITKLENDTKNNINHKSDLVVKILDYLKE